MNPAISIPIKTYETEVDLQLPLNSLQFVGASTVRALDGDIFHMLAEMLGNVRLRVPARRIDEPRENHQRRTQMEIIS